MGPPRRRAVCLDRAATPVHRIHLRCGDAGFFPAACASSREVRVSPLKSGFHNDGSKMHRETIRVDSSFLDGFTSAQRGVSSYRAGQSKRDATALREAASAQCFKCGKASLYILYREKGINQGACADHRGALIRWRKTRKGTV